MPAAIAKRWFSKIETTDQALQVVKDTSNVFLVIAAIQAAGSFLVGYSILVDAVIYASGGFILRKYNSRAAAVSLLILTGIAVVATVGNKLGMQLGGGTNVFLALIVFWAGVRAVLATYKLHKLKQLSPNILQDTSA
jgi:hypothetical protein